MGPESGGESSAPAAESSDSEVGEGRPAEGSDAPDTEHAGGEGADAEGTESSAEGGADTSSRAEPGENGPPQAGPSDTESTSDDGGDSATAGIESGESSAEDDAGLADHTEPGENGPAQAEAEDPSEEGGLDEGEPSEPPEPDEPPEPSEPSEGSDAEEPDSERPEDVESAMAESDEDSDEMPEAEDEASEQPEEPEESATVDGGSDDDGAGSAEGESGTKTEQPPAATTDQAVDQILGRVNPNYERTNPAYSQNCTGVVQANELQRRGFDVQAGPLEPELHGAGRSLSTIEQAWGRDFTPGTKSEIDAAFQEPGSRGVVYIRWDTGGGHVFNVENVNGTVRFVDGQTIPPRTDASGYFDRGGQTKYLRLDDLPTPPSSATAKYVQPRSR
jgi:hypothetical protein